MFYIGVQSAKFVKLYLTFAFFADWFIRNLMKNITIKEISYRDFYYKFFHQISVNSEIFLFSVYRVLLFLYN